MYVKNTPLNYRFFPLILFQNLWVVTLKKENNV